MGEVYKELDEVKAELEKLKEDCRIKRELSESLRRAHSDQQAKCQEANLQVEKQAKELNVKSDEIVELRKVYEEVKSKLHATESSLKQVTSVNEKLRIDSGEKVQRLEVENRKIVSALEEATGRNDDLEQKIRVCNEENKGLKGRLSELQRKFSEAEEKARAGKELRHREDVIIKLEEESMSVQDQLKWKKEQFQHLEEAHKRLQDQFQLSKKEWASEKSAMLEEIGMLQGKLDSQIRITESLESRLKMCNQALAHEESKRKLMEVQLSDSKQRFENVLVEYEEAKAKIESLSTKRDEDIASLRNSLGMKEVLFKEMEYKVTHLEQDNKELLGTVKELQEAQINKRKIDPSTSKLRNKLKDLEQAHSKCSLTLKEREADWMSKMEKLIEEMKSYESYLKRQNEQVHQLKTQLDHCQSVIEVSGEETSILFMVLKSVLFDVYSKLFDMEAHTEAFSKETAKKILISAEHVDMGDSSPSKAEGCLKQAREEIGSLTQKLESLKFLEERGSMLEDALEQHKKMLKESSQSQLCLKEQVNQMEATLKNVSVALEKSNSALTAKISEAGLAEAQLQLWKSKAESFRICLEQSQEVCKKLETSTLEQIEIEKGLRSENKSFQCKLKAQEQRITDLQQTLAALNQMLEQKDTVVEETKIVVAKALVKEGHLIQLLKEKDAVFENLQKQLKVAEEQSVKRITAAADSAKLEAQRKFECEKEVLCRIIQEENAAIENLGGELDVLRKQSTTAEFARLKAETRFADEKEELSQVIKDKDAAVENLKKQIEVLRQQSLAAESARLEEETTFQHEKEELSRAIKEKDAEVLNLMEEIEMLKQQSAAAESARLEAETTCAHERKELSQVIRENNTKVGNLVEEIKVLKQQSAAAESARLESEIRFEHEKEKLAREIVSEKDEKIRRIQASASTLEQDFVEVFFSILCKDVENLVKMFALQEALDKSEFYMNNEMEKKDNAIVILETEISNLHDTISLQEDSLLHSNQSVKELEASAEAKKLEMEKLILEFDEGQAKLKELVKELELKNGAATEDIDRLSSERESLLNYIEGICDQVGNFCMQGDELEGMLGKMTQNSDKDDMLALDAAKSDRISAHLQKLVRKELEPGLHRSPLQERNQ